MTSEHLSRRGLLTGAAAGGTILLLDRQSASAKARSGANPSSRPRLGIVARVGESVTPDAALARVRRLGFSSCQLSVGMAPPEWAGPIRDAVARHNVEITALMTLGEGRMVWNWREGPKTIGIVPTATRAARIEALKRASRLAKACGVPAVHTHCGFIPENPNDAAYPGVVAAVREVASFVHENGQTFLMETGQETPITLLRAVQDAAVPNIAVNLDVANLILYGTGEPVGALDVLGPHVKGLHAKDGLYPTDPYGLGKETAIGKGCVRFPEVMSGLRKLNYAGPITIEREISGPEQERDIAQSKTFLTNLIDHNWPA
jgi:L-ribulose-5-phosphate 3-epimerase